MIGNLPGGNDFNFKINGYPCALGVDTFNLDSGGVDYAYRLVKMKAKAAQPSSIITQWEYVDHLALNGRENEDPKILLNEFLAQANPKLIKATGGTVPELPKTFLEQCRHLVRYNLTFDIQTGLVALKV